MMPFLPLVLAPSQRVVLTPFLDDGNTRTHRYTPDPLRLVRRGSALTTVLTVGPLRFPVRISGTDGKATLFVDRNRNGVMQPNERVYWTRETGVMPGGAPLTRYRGEVSLVLGGGQVARYDLVYLQSKTTDPSFARFKNGMVAIPQYGYLGKANFGGRAYRFGIRGSDTAHGGLFIDRDDDGILGTVPAEMFSMDRPFNVGGKSYRVTSFDPLHSSVTFTLSKTQVAEVPMPADLRVGKIAPTVPSRTLAGKPIAFPTSFRGKLVMLDVWATWCGPCRAEIPYMRDAYAKFKRKGFEIVSYSIDDPGKQREVAKFTQAAGETWPQAFEGMGWQSPVCRRYNITGIPFFLLVDGSTGRIVASGDDLRGPQMAPTIAAALAKRR